MITFLALAVICGVLIADPSKQTIEVPTLEKRGEVTVGNASYSTETIEGWVLHIDQKLSDQSPSETAKAKELLRAQLVQISQLLPLNSVTDLRRVQLWFSLYIPNERPPTAEYHPDAGWLRRHHRNPAMAKGVEFTNIGIFEREYKRMPMFVLHELAHAFHDQVLGHDQPEIIAAYERSVRSGQYNRVQRWTGESTVTARAYALSNFKEYFAETTEAYFGRNDFEPFDREELRRMDPGMCDLLERLWNSK